MDSSSLRAQRGNPGLSEPQLEEYLQRVVASGSVMPAQAGIQSRHQVLDPSLRWDDNQKTVQLLHRSHTHSIPFERLDRFYKIPVVLEPDAIFNKLVTRKRGGGCYEMNSLLHLALQSLGFENHRCAAQLFDDNNVLNPASVHMLLCVQLDKPWLVDAGYGGYFIPPLPIVHGASEGAYLIEQTDDKFTLLRGDKKMYRFSLEPRDLDFFKVRNDYHNSSESSLGKHPFCWLPRSNGFDMIRGQLYMKQSADQTFEKVIDSNAEFHSLLKDRFGIEV
jgi:N-hydroxyarylamine O-acetyltransferase